uniref:HAD family hydrolase n=1 Tax=Bradyrhizobium barranii subsp. barranii TaxID=2823807 RepID=A0A939MKG5_9BRAD
MFTCPPAGDLPPKHCRRRSVFDERTARAPVGDLAIPGGYLSRLNGCDPAITVVPGGSRAQAETGSQLLIDTGAPDGRPGARITRASHDDGPNLVLAGSSSLFHDIAGIGGLVDATTSSDDAEESKPAPDIFEAALGKLGIAGADAVAIGDTPYDASAARKAGIAAIGVLCGGFAEASLRGAGCAEVYPGPASLLALFDESLLAK